MKTKLTNLGLVGRSDWIELVGPEVYAEMVKVRHNGQDVEVLCIAVDGCEPESSYYDVRLPSGTVVDALQGVHLENICDYVEPPAPVHGTGAQYMVELIFPATKPVAHVEISAIELLIREAVREKLLPLGIEVGAVAYETDYPLADPKEL